jgi:hypothetical protein
MRVVYRDQGRDERCEPVNPLLILLHRRANSNKVFAQRVNRPRSTGIARRIVHRTLAMGAFGAVIATGCVSDISGIAGLREAA